MPGYEDRETDSLENPGIYSERNGRGAVAPEWLDLTYTVSQSLREQKKERRQGGLQGFWRKQLERQSCHQLWLEWLWVEQLWGAQELSLGHVPFEMLVDRVRDWFCPISSDRKKKTEKEQQVESMMTYQLSKKKKKKKQFEEGVVSCITCHCQDMMWTEGHSWLR